VFRGRFEHSLDGKGRLSIPARFREQLQQRGQTVLFLAELDGCVQAFPMDEWRRVEEKLVAKGTMERNVQTLLRLVSSAGVEAPLDAQGRILIPPAIRESTELNRGVILVGMLSRFEIWGRGRWARFLAGSRRVQGKLSETLAELGV
jgi:MraZ protein